MYGSCTNLCYDDGDGTVVVAVVFVVIATSIILLLSDVSISNGLHIRINTHHRTYDDLIRARAYTHTHDDCVCMCEVLLWPAFDRPVLFVSLLCLLRYIHDTHHQIVVLLLLLLLYYTQIFEKSNHTFLISVCEPFGFDVVIVVARAICYPILQPYSLAFAVVFTS